MTSQLQSSSTRVFSAAFTTLITLLLPSPNPTGRLFSLLPPERTAFPRARHRKFKPSYAKNRRGR